jgi:membrane peptidoglycan carboxypeptidase
VQIAQSMGVKQANGQPLAQVPAFTLGAEDVDPLAVTGAFATFANQGKHCAPEAITRVTTSITGLTPPSVPASQCVSSISPDVANGVTSLLTGVIDQPGATGAGLSIGRPAAGKTGTDDNYKNGWFGGYTPNLASAVWVGNPDSATPMQNIVVNGVRYPEVFGATLAGRIWKLAMTNAVKPLPVETFARPPDSVLQGEPIRVPDVTGQDPADARASLIKLGFSVATDMPQVSSTQPAGKVDSTNPAAGSIGHVGDSVTILVSNGIPPAPVSPPPASSSPPHSPGPITSPPASPPATVAPTQSPKKKKKHG